MCTTKESVSTRLSRYLGYKQIPKTTFEDQAGFSRGYIRSIGDAPHKSTVAKIQKVATDLNIGWLLTGEGSMLLHQDSTSPEMEVKRDLQEPDLDGSAQRISALINHLKEIGVVHSQSHFADLIGYGRATVSQAKNGRIRTPLAFLISISETFPSVSLDWLLYGTGEMMVQKHHPEGDTPDTLSEISTTLTQIRDLLSKIVTKVVERP